MPASSSRVTIRSAACSAERLARVDMDFGVLGPLVRRVDAREVLDLAAPRLLVETLGIALLGELERCVDEDLEELPGGTSSRAMRRSERNGDMKDTSTMRPASTISRDTSATRRMFSTRSTSVKPRSLLRP